jgi:hypothetical protein
MSFTPLLLFICVILYHFYLQVNDPPPSHDAKAIEPGVMGIAPFLIGVEPGVMGIAPFLIRVEPGVFSMEIAPFFERLQTYTNPSLWP